MISVKRLKISGVWKEMDSSIQIKNLLLHSKIFENDKLIRHTLLHVAILLFIIGNPLPQLITNLQITNHQPC